jgi:hypothetical protein
MQLRTDLSRGIRCQAAVARWCIAASGHRDLTKRHLVDVFIVFAFLRMRITAMIVLISLPVLLEAQGPGSPGSTPVMPGQLLGPRIGAEIDVAEREYFNLFPGAEGFSYASLEAVGDRVRIVLYRDSLSYGQISLTARDAAFLRSYVEHFEAITYRERGSAAEALIDNIEDATLLLSLPDLEDIGVLEVSRRKPWTDNTVRILMEDSTVFEYSLLSADVRSLYVWDGAPHYAADTIAVRLRRIPMDSVLSLRYDAPTGFTRAFALPFVLTMGMLQKFISHTTRNLNDRSNIPASVLTGTLLSALMALPTSATIGGLGSATPLRKVLALPARAQERQRVIAEFLGDEENACVPPPEVAAEIQKRRVWYAGDSIAGHPEQNDEGVGETYTSPWWVGGEYVVNIYGTESQLYNIGIGLTVAREFALMRDGNGNSSLSLRVRLAGGLTYLSGEAMTRLQLPARLSVLAGFNWLRAEDNLGYARPGSRYTLNRSYINELRHEKPLQEVSWVIGVAADHGSTRIELQYRRLVLPALSLTSEFWTHNGAWVKQTEIHELTTYPIISLLVALRI